MASQRKRDGSVRSVSQRMADYYSGCGIHLAFVQVYADEALVYAQVAEPTARSLDRRVRVLARHYDVLEGPTLSLDGSTWCWWLRSHYAGLTPTQLGGMAKHGTTPPDWLRLLMPAIYVAFRDTAPKAMARDADGRVTLMHADNRRLDANTVAAFSGFLAGGTGGTGKL